MNPGSVIQGSRRQRGLSLVELMVGITIGLIVVAGATLLTATQLSENRRLLLETQVQQDLRAAVDIISREVRRGGYDRNAYLRMWSPDNPGAQPAPSPWAGLVLNDGAEIVRYRYERPGMLAPSFAYQWDSVTGRIRHRIGNDAPQELTDRTSVVIDSFTVDPVPGGVTRQLACPTLCADGTQNCWPKLSLNEVDIVVTGHPINNLQLTRTVRSRVRLRNDDLDYVGQACP